MAPSARMPGLLDARASGLSRGRLAQWPEQCVYATLITQQYMMVFNPPLGSTLSSGHSLPGTVMGLPAELHHQ
jgi:hypothetical protein